MIAKFQFWLDGTLVMDPLGWADLDTTIKRDAALAGLLQSQESELEFFADGHAYLKSVSDSQDFCSEVNIVIKQTYDQLNYETIFIGIIRTSEIVFYLQKCSAKVKTVDDGFYARINTNKSIKAFINVGKSKNGLVIAPAADIVAEFFYPPTGVYPVQADRHVYRIFEVFKFLVAFMSDGKMDFVSTDFDIGGKWEGVSITLGNEINNADQAFFPQVSFQETFTEINKKLRIGFAVEYIGGRPTLRIENMEYFYSQSSSVTLPNAEDVTMQIATEQLYAQVHLGSSTTDDLVTPLGSFPEGIRYIGFIDETYQVVGTCNIDSTLELASEWIISSNIIQRSFDPNHVAAYDEDIFLLHVDLGVPNKLHQSNWIDPSASTPMFYNEIFNNDHVTQNWFKGIPNQIAQYLGNADDTFLATKTAFQAITNVNYWVKFEDDFTPPNYDGNGNYDPVTIPNRYVIPSSGLYTFEASLNCSGAVYICELRIERRDATGATLISNTLIASLLLNQLTGNFTITGVGSIYANATDIIEVTVQNIPTGLTFSCLSGSTFKCTRTTTGGGIVGTSNPADYKVKKYTFKYPITAAAIKTILTDTKKQITFTTNNGIVVSGWIDLLKYYRHNKDADITLITN